MKDVRVHLLIREVLLIEEVVDRVLHFGRIEVVSGVNVVDGDVVSGGRAVRGEGRVLGLVALDRREGFVRVGLETLHFHYYLGCVLAELLF